MKRKDARATAYFADSAGQSAQWEKWGSEDIDRPLTQLPLGDRNAGVCSRAAILASSIVFWVFVIWGYWQLVKQ